MDYAEGTDHTFTVRWQQITDDGQRPVARAAVRFNQGSRRRADARTAHRITDQAQHGLFELGLRTNLDRRAVREKCFGDLTKVLHVRAEDNRFPVERGLEDVMAAGRHQASAYEHDGCKLIELRQLADRVEHDRVGARLRVDRQLRPSDRDESFMATEALDLVEPFGMARGDDQQRVGTRGPDAIERANDRLLFAFRRAARDDHRAARRDPEKPEHALAAASRRWRRFERIELQTAGDRDPRRIGAELDEPARCLVALYAETIDVAEDPLDEGTDHAIPRKRSVRDAAVDHLRLDATPPAFAKQVRPDLRFDHDEQTRPDDIQGPARGERPVEREIEHGIDVRHAAARELLTGERRRREKEPQLRIARAQPGDQRTRAEHLANRHGVHPDRFIAVEIEGDGEIAEPLSDAADVLVVPQRLVEEVRRRQHEDDAGDEAVEEIHAKLR